MCKFGIKLWSINKNYIDSSIKLFENSKYSYIELYVLPGTFDEYNNLWKSLKIPYVIHAPHYSHGLNLSKKEQFKNNMQLIKETKKWADILNAEYIIIHPGVDGDYKESAIQFSKLRDERVLVENKPYYTIKGDSICVGSTPNEIKYIMDIANIGFCFDVGHAICSSNALKKELMEFLLDFNKLNPKMYHISNGELTSVKDTHKHMNAGNFPFEKIKKIINHNCKITLESEKTNSDNLDDVIIDLQLLNDLIC